MTCVAVGDSADRMPHRGDLCRRKGQIGLASWSSLVRIRPLMRGRIQGFFRKHKSLERFMKAGRVALAVIAIAAATSGQAEARIHHRHSHAGCHLYDDYTHSNALSASSYIYPAANWGPFFHCRMYYSPVLVAPAAP
jgi:hypothetical protein